MLKQLQVLSVDLRIALVGHYNMAQQGQYITMSYLLYNDVVIAMK